MAGGRLTRIALRLAAGVTLAFIYIPIGVIVLYSFNASDLVRWPITELTLDWYVQAFNDEGIRKALLASLQAAIGATTVALVLGSLIAFAVHRFRFFGREGLSFLILLPIALPGIVTGIALNTTFRTFGIDFGLLTVIIGHATFCVVVIYNNVVARLRRTAPSAQEASMDLGADTWQTFRRITLPAIGHIDRRGRAACLRPVVRRDHRDDVHGRRGHADAPDLDLLELLPAEPAPAGQRRVGHGPGALDHPGLLRRADHLRPRRRRGHARLGSRRPGLGLNPLAI